MYLVSLDGLKYNGLQPSEVAYRHLEAKKDRDKHFHKNTSEKTFR
jgi:hypothetical protein